ncbi:MAG: SDR family NAD(P)-dependent oxidoreductase [Steroidobacteraceae bacterium]
MSSRVSFEGQTAVITGAGSGIGRALALDLAERGCHLALADIRGQTLSETRELLAAHQHRRPTLRVSTHVLDVASRDAIDAFPEAVLAEHPTVNLLFNNAGVAIEGDFRDIKPADFEWLMDINFWGVVRMTRAFLPILERSETAHITNISSLFGLIAPAGQSAYVASKFAVRGFSDALRHELEQGHIGVTVVCPGGVNTSIARNARQSKDLAPADLERRLARVQKLLRLPPSDAAKIILAAVERRDPRVIVGTDAKIGAWAERLMPITYWKLARKLMF